MLGPVSRLVWILCAVVLVGCYDPTLPDCVLACTKNSECPDGKLCGDLGLCAAPAAVNNCGIIDASPSAGNTDAGIDGLPPDAPVGANDETCKKVCQAPGVCEKGVCTFRCNSMGSTLCTDAAVVCPKGVACHVICGGNACTKGIDCREATSCDIDCDGNKSCTQAIRCGAGPCDVHCARGNTCTQGVQCGDACSCSITCPQGCTVKPSCPMGCDTPDNRCTDESLSCRMCKGVAPAEDDAPEDDQASSVDELL
jgi:hypothetical protein